MARKTRSKQHSATTKKRTAVVQQRKQNKRFGVPTKSSSCLPSKSTLLHSRSILTRTRTHERASSTCSTTSATQFRQNTRRPTARATVASGSREQQDFEREWSSLQERQRNHNSTSKPPPVVVQRQQRGSTFTIQPATLVLQDADKSTSRLVEEATQRVHQTGLLQVHQHENGTDSLFGSASRVVQRSNPQTQRGNVSRSYEWQALTAQHCAMMTNKEETTETCRENPFAALEDAHDSSDEEEQIHDTSSSTLPLSPKPLFTFAPASFRVPTLSHEVMTETSAEARLRAHSATHKDGDSCMDPDL